MKRSSLRRRFALASIVSAFVLALVLGVALQGVFEAHVERAAVEELNADLRYLARSLRIEGDEVKVQVLQLPDPRFQEAFSGLYWQIYDDRTGAVTRSASLATFTLPLPPDDLALGEVHRHILIGPEGSKLIVLERRIAEGLEAKAAFRFAVAIDRAVIAQSYQAFVRDLFPLLGMIALGLFAASAVQAGYALAPLQQARRALQAVREGKRDRLGEAVPQELASLAAEFDAMIAAEKHAAQKSRERAADLAHGLKTPLAVLRAQARDLRVNGEIIAADGIDDVVADLDARVSRELARAQILGPSPRRPAVPAAPIVERLVKALGATREGEGLAWNVDIDQDFTVRLDAADLTELLGALAHNAAKWAKTAVRLSATGAGESWALVVDDDGPGIAPQDRRAALRRGSGLDATRSGSGLGLAIAQDIARAYGASLSLEDSPMGGLRVKIARGAV